MPYNIYRDERFDRPSWVQKILPKNVSIGVMGFSFRYDPKEPLSLLELDGYLTAVADQSRTAVAPPSRFEQKTLSPDEIKISNVEESKRFIGRTTGLDETYHVYLLHLGSNWTGYDAGKYFTCLLRPSLDSEVPCSYSEFLGVKLFAVPYLDESGHQMNYGDFLHLLRVREIFLIRQ